MRSLACLLIAAALPAHAQVDHTGRPFVTQKAPTLRFATRSAPRPYGIDYAFADQTARGVAVFSRFPAFTLTDRRIHVSGPWYDAPDANLHFTRGIASIDALPNFRLEGAATSVRALPPERKWQLMTDPLLWGRAAALADDLEKADPADARIAPLRAFARDHVFTAHEDAYTELGRRVWRDERWATDERGGGVLYPSLDIEMTGGWEHQRSCFGWIYRGMAQAAQADGFSIQPLTYGQWLFSVGTVAQSVREGPAGWPEYLRPDRDCLAGSDPTLRVVGELGGVRSMDGYVQAIWGEEPFYRRGSDGALLLEDGRPAFAETRSTTAYGQAVPLEPGEARRCLEGLYRQAARMQILQHHLAGDYPSDSRTRRPLFGKARAGAWTRITNEGLQGIEQNDRPLPGWLLETLVLMYLFTADDVVVWSSDFNHAPGPPGSDHSREWRYEAHGVMERVVKAAHRYSALDPLHRGPYRWCWFNLAMADRNETEGDRYHQKPLALGKLRTYRGRPWLEFFWAFPALDGTPGEMRVWVERDGKRSPAYVTRVPGGRASFYDGWQLPAAFAGAEGRDVWVQFRDAAGVTRTLRGDWRYPVPAGVKPPPDQRGGA